MTLEQDSVVARLVSSVLGAAAGAHLLSLLEPTGEAPAPARPGAVERTQFAAALTMLLFDDLLRRVPSAAAYVQDVRAGGGRAVGVEVDPDQIDGDDLAVRQIRRQGIETGRIVQPAVHRQHPYRRAGVMHLRGHAQTIAADERALGHAHGWLTMSLPKPGQPAQ